MAPCRPKRSELSAPTMEPALKKIALGNPFCNVVAVIHLNAMRALRRSIIEGESTPVLPKP